MQWTLIFFVLASILFLTHGDSDITEVKSLKTIGTTLNYFEDGEEAVLIQASNATVHIEGKENKRIHARVGDSGNNITMHIMHRYTLETLVVPHAEGYADSANFYIDTDTKLEYIDKNGDVKASTYGSAKIKVEAEGDALNIHIQGNLNFEATQY